MERGAGMGMNFKPYKKQPQGNKTVIIDLVRQNGGASDSAAILQLDESTVYNMCDFYHDARMSFERVAALTTPKSPAAAHHLAEKAGGYFVPVDRCGDSLQAALSRTAKEIGDLTTVMIASAADGRFCAVDKEAIRKELRQTLNEIVRAQQALELATVSA